MKQGKKLSKDFLLLFPPLLLSSKRVLFPSFDLLLCGLNVCWTDCCLKWGQQEQEKAKEVVWSLALVRGFPHCSTGFVLGHINNDMHACLEFQVMKIASTPLSNRLYLSTYRLHQHNQVLRNANLILYGKKKISCYQILIAGFFNIKKIQSLTRFKDNFKRIG